MSSQVLAALLVGLVALASARAQVGSYAGGSVALAPASLGVAGNILQDDQNSVRLHSVVGSGAAPTSASARVSLRAGFAGQLYELTSVRLEPSPFTVDEEGSRLLRPASAELDDGTWLSLLPLDISWSALDGPVTGVNSFGLATAGIVYEDTLATVQARVLNLVSPLNLTVLDINSDNFGSYAGDGLSDDWQVGFFGLDNPDAGPGRDPDGDRQFNEFEEMAGVDPTDPNSKFRFSIQRNSMEPDWVDLLFSPRWDDREYTVHFTRELETPFNALTDEVVTDSGLQRTVTDRDGSALAKFYIIRITRP